MDARDRTAKHRRAAEAILEGLAGLLGSTDPEVVALRQAYQRGEPVGARAAELCNRKLKEFQDRTTRLLKEAQEALAKLQEKKP